MSAVLQYGISWSEIFVLFEPFSAGRIDGEPCHAVVSGDNRTSGLLRKEIVKSSKIVKLRLLRSRALSESPHPGDHPPPEHGSAPGDPQNLAAEGK